MPRTRKAELDDRSETARVLGTLLAEARIRAGISQSEAARALGVPQSRIARLELGQRQLRFVEGLRLAELYKVAPAEFDPHRVT